MKQPIRLILALSASALFVSACSTAPYDASSADGGSTYSSTGSVPEAGPLTSGGAVGGSNYAYTQPPVYQPQAPAPVVTAPVSPANTYAYNQPDAGGTYDSYAAGGNTGGNTGGGYDYSANMDGGNTGGNPGGGYDYSASAGGGNDTYNSYGGGGGDTYASTGGNNYYSGGGSNSGGGNNNYAASGGSGGGGAGGAAVQIFASGSSSKAEQIRNSMASRGLNAVVDQVDGLYKVRVPFSSETEARANLIRVRSASGESGAFVTFR